MIKLNFTHFIIGLTILFLTNAVAHAGDTNDVVMLGAGAAAIGSVVAVSSVIEGSLITGNDLMKYCGAGPSFATLCAIGGSLIAAAAIDLIDKTDKGNSATAIDSTIPGNGGTGTSPISGGVADTTLPTPGSPGGLNTLSPTAQAAYNNAQKIAAANGTTISALADKGDEAIKNGNFDPNDPAIMAALKLAQKEVKSNFKVSSVATIDSSGGGRQNRANTDGGLDLNALMNQMKNRQPASVAGLQKTLNGEAIGVAGDNIFQQVTRKYKNKISGQSFLAPASAQQTLHHN
jgi:hypothetical protein